MTERKPGQDGQNSGDSCFVRRIKGPDGTVYTAVDAELLIRRAEVEDPYGGAFGNSPLVTLREPPTFRGRHTMGTPRLKESS